MCKILELDLDTDEIRFVKLNLSLDGIGGIASENNRIVWMVGRGHIVNKIIKWDIENDVIKEIDCPLDEKNCLVPFYAPLCYKTESSYFQCIQIMLTRLMQKMNQLLYIKYLKI